MWRCALALNSALPASSSTILSGSIAAADGSSTGRTLDTGCSPRVSRGPALLSVHPLATILASQTAVTEDGRLSRRGLLGLLGGGIDAGPLGAKEHRQKLAQMPA